MRRTPVTYIENGFPVESLHKLALREGNSKRPIYQVHKWWARRLGSVFRTLLISSFIGPQESEKDLWGRYYNGFSLKDTVICDPFMGGGTSVVEALRLGCKVIGTDINPVAWFVTKKEVEHFDEVAADKEYDKLKNTVGETIRRYYKTKCPTKHDAEIIYTIWIRRIRCGTCGKDHDLLNNYVIRETNKEKTILCPHCDELFTTKSKRNRISCRNCGKTVKLDAVPAERGDFTCPSCKTTESVSDAAIRNGAPLPTRMLCIEYDCPVCGRGYKIPDKHDEALYHKAKLEFRKNKRHLQYPRQRISVRGRSDGRPMTHGFHYYSQLFNDRQLLCLTALLKQIKKISDENLREFLLLNFSSILETNNVLCKYETKWGKIGALFAIPAYHVPYRYGENNLWGIGRGTFPRSYLKLKRGKKFSAKPFERKFDENESKKSQRQFLNEVSTAEVSVTKLDLQSSKRAFIFWGDSKKPLKGSEGKIDAIITDPPYFDTIMYSELADFFYVWLRLGLKKRYKWFRDVTSQRVDEIVVNRRSGKSEDMFVADFTRVLQNLNTSLKPKGLLVFTFHHTQKWAWEGLRRALSESGFKVTATHIIRSEGSTGYRKDGGSTSYDVCVVCRKTSFDAFIKDQDILESCIEKVTLLNTLDEELRDSDIFTVAMSKYLLAKDDSAQQIMQNIESLVREIKDKARLGSRSVKI